MTQDLTVGFCLAHLDTGGVERNTVRLLAPLRARGIRTVLFLQHLRGDLLRALPEGQAVVDLGGRGMLGTSRALAKAWRRHPVDVLYTATNALNIAALLAARQSLRAPRIVVGEHIPLGPFLDSRKRPGQRRALMRALYGRAAAVVAPTQPILDEHRALLGRRCPPCHVLPNPAIDALAAPRPQPAQARRFVSLGRLSPDKDFALALRAFGVHLRSDPAAHLTLWGQGEERDALMALARELQITRNLSMPGVTRDVPRALAQADLFLCSSQVEGFGNAIVEAQAAGVPVLSVDCPFGPRLLLQGGQAGRLIDSRDPETLGRALSDFAADPDARTQAAEKARDAAATYTVEASAEAHAALFRALV